MFPPQIYLFSHSQKISKKMFFIFSLTLSEVTSCLRSSCGKEARGRANSPQFLNCAAVFGDLYLSRNHHFGLRRFRPGT
jgi:hypothetical protein